jgi:prepilin-type N-terminal cleavage/methylation domain-containing protein
MRTRTGFTLIELMIVIAIIAIIAAIAIPGLLMAQRTSHERSASASLKTLASAQADMKGHDRDGNGISDYWTGDIYALYGLVPMSAGMIAPPADTPEPAAGIKLIDISVAAADGASVSALYGNVTFAVAVPGASKSSYIYRVFAAVDEGGGVRPLANDTDGPGAYGPVHDRTRFAFLAFPETYSAGRLIFLLSTENTIWKYNLPAPYQATFAPIAVPATDSTSTCLNTGQPAFETAAFFPPSPQAVGCSKMD